jgi:hypothetical protein
MFDQTLQPISLQLQNLERLRSVEMAVRMSLSLAEFAAGNRA